MAKLLQFAIDAAVSAGSSSLAMDCSEQRPVGPYLVDPGRGVGRKPALVSNSGQHFNWVEKQMASYSVSAGPLTL
jgi:hypothetical protein